MTPTWKQIRTWSAVCFVCACGLLGAYVAQHNTRGLQHAQATLKHVTAQNLALILELKQQVKRINRLAVATQNQRKQSILDDCRNDNRKYDTTIAELRTFGVVPPRIATLIGDIVPHHSNCMALVHEKAPES